MATSLLLEGDNLEELLIRARQEGGPLARIVRAEKVRQGGVLGFFARERYEVAIEVPDGEVIGRHPDDTADEVTEALAAAFAEITDAPTDEAGKTADVPSSDGKGGLTRAQPSDSGSAAASPAETLLRRRIDRFLDSAEVAVAPHPAHDDSADERPVGGSPAERLVAAGNRLEPDDGRTSVAEPERQAPEFAPFGQVFEAARNAFSAQVAGAVEPATTPVEPAIAESAPILHAPEIPEIPETPQTPETPENAETPNQEGERVADVLEPTEEVAGPGAESDEPATGPHDDDEVQPAAPIEGILEPGEQHPSQLSTVLTAERGVSRSVAGQPLGAPSAPAFRVPVRSGAPHDERAAVDPAREQELAAAAQTAAYAAVYAVVHEDGVAGRHALPASSAWGGPDLALPGGTSEDWQRPHSAERGMVAASGHWRFVPTHSHMVTGFPGAGSHNDQMADSRPFGARPEFTALLEQLRARAGATAGGIPAAHSHDGLSSTTAWGLDNDTELIPEPIAAQTAWSVVEQLEAAYAVQDPPADPYGDGHADLPARAEAELVPTDPMSDVVQMDEGAHFLGDHILVEHGEDEDYPQYTDLVNDEGHDEQGLDEELDAVDDAPAPVGVEPAEPARTIPLPRRSRATRPVSTDREPLAADRAMLRQLGVPPAWIRRLRGGDRYSDIWQALDLLPEVDIDPQTRVVAVVGPAENVRLEAHRTAVDMAIGDSPRAVVVVPGVLGAERAGALTQAARLGCCVVAVEAEADTDPAMVVESLATVGAGAVIVIVDATQDLDAAQTRLDDLGSVDAIALEGVAVSAAPMQMMQLGVPITRLDGIPIDRMTWTALLCAQLEAATPAGR